MEFLPKLERDMGKISEMLQNITSNPAMFTSHEDLYEYACHEGNHGLVGILAGWRYQESLGNNGDGSPRSDTGVV